MQAQVLRNPRHWSLCPERIPLSKSIFNQRKPETHPDHYEDDADGTKDGLGWGIARDFLHEIEDFDKPIQH